MNICSNSNLEPVLRFKPPMDSHGLGISNQKSWEYNRKQQTFFILPTRKYKHGTFVLKLTPLVLPHKYCSPISASVTPSCPTTWCRKWDVHTVGLTTTQKITISHC